MFTRVVVDFCHDGSFAFSMLPQDTREACLLKMSIGPQGNRDRMFPHDEEARTVNETPRFVLVFCE